MSRTRLRIYVNKIKLVLAVISIPLLRTTAYFLAWVSLLPAVLKGSTDVQEDTRWVDMEKY